MTTSFYIRRFLAAFAIAAAVISVAQLLKGNDAGYAIREGLLWGVITAVVYTGVLARKLRRCPIPANDPDAGGVA